MIEEQKSERTDPKTCLHNVIIAKVVKVSPKVHCVLHCISCETDISKKAELLKRKNYEFDLSHGVWVHVPKTRVKK